MAKFRLSGINNAYQVAVFDQQKVTMGRSKSNDFVIDDGAVSRYQAEITLQKNGFQLKNIGRFPVTINRAAVDCCILQTGDILTLGNHSHFRFEAIETGEDLVTVFPEASLAIDIEDIISGFADKDSSTKSSNSTSDSGNNDYHTDQSVAGDAAFTSDQIDTNEMIFADEKPITNRNPSVWDAQAETNEFMATIAQINQRMNNPVVAMREADNTALADDAIALVNGEETLIDPVPALLKVLSGPKPGTSHLLEKPRFVIGRAADSDMVIDDQRVSRNHVAIEKRDSEYHLLRLTQHQTVLVNSQPVNQCRLFNNDLIEFFTLSFTFKSTNLADQPTPEPQAPLPFLPLSLDETSLSDATVLQSDFRVKKPGPRLVNHSKYGGSTVYKLDHGRNCLGRDTDCDVVIEGDKSVSRLHAVIEKQAKGHSVSAESINPLLLNSKRVRSSSRIYSGDTLQLGDTLLTFLSEFREDQSPAKKWTSKVILPVTLALSIALLGLLIYSQLWQPWTIEQQIANAEQHINKAEIDQGQSILKALYTQRLDFDQRSQVANLLSMSNLAQVSHDIEQGSLEPARDRLVSFLRQYGADQEMAESWRQLNEIRFLLAKSYYAQGSIKAALKEYVAIDGDSELYNSAQKAISDIWFESQTRQPAPESADSLEVDRLLAEAELLFEKQHFLTPINNNAYALYAQILEYDAGNPIALSKIAAMKAFYRQEGNRLCSRGDQALAETYFRRYLIIEPENAAMQQALANINHCTNLTEVVAINTQNKNDQTAAGQPKATNENPQILISEAPGDDTGADNSQNKQKITNLLKQEGVESTWIIEYLFDEPKDNGGQPDAETPW